MLLIIKSHFILTFSGKMMGEWMVKTETKKKKIKKSILCNWVRDDEVEMEPDHELFDLTVHLKKKKPIISRPFLCSNCNFTFLLTWRKLYWASILLRRVKVMKFSERFLCHVKPIHCICVFAYKGLALWKK